MDFNKLTQQASGFLNKQSEGSSSTNAEGANTNLNQSANQSADPAAQTQAMGNTAQPGTNTNTGDMDYGDKGLAFIEQKTGHSMGRDTNEKITDGARGMFEKFTGKKVDPKYSN